MMFCPKCKSIMMPKSKNQFVCSCGYKQAAESVTLTEQGKKVSEVTVVEKETIINPIVEAECSECGNRKAETWDVQTRSADEPPTRFHKCIKCKHTWRDYK